MSDRPLSPDVLRPSFPRWLHHQRELAAAVRAGLIIRHIIEQVDDVERCTLYFRSSRSSSYTRMIPSKTWARFERSDRRRLAEFVEGRANRKQWADFPLFVANLPPA